MDFSNWKWLNVANAPFLYTEVTGELELKTVGNLRAGM